MKSLRPLYRIRLTKMPDIAGTKARAIKSRSWKLIGGTDKKQLSLITHIKVEPADKHDANALLPALKNTDKRDMAPKELLADSLYGRDDNVQKAKQDYQTDVLAPLMGAKNKVLGLEHFTMDSNYNSRFNFEYFTSCFSIFKSLHNLFFFFNYSHQTQKNFLN